MQPTIYTHPKLTETGCRCPCNTVHAPLDCCDITATTNALHYVMGDPIELPMCYPCAMAYQRYALAVASRKP